MIKEKTVNIKIIGKRIEIYNKLGYNVKYNDIIEILVEQLQKGSHEIITGICDVCGKEKKMMYKTYIVSTDNTYCCRKCSKLKKNKTMKKRYGVEHALQSNTFKDKAKDTWLLNLGVDHPSKSKIIKNKFNTTMLERYGEKNALQNNSIKEKMFLNQIKNNNGLYFVQTDAFKEKSKNTCLEKYGENYYLQTKDKKDKSKLTCLEKYGVEHSSQCSYVFNKILKTSKKMIKYKNSNLFYQGSYEKNFLELCEELNILDKIKRGFSVRYNFDNNMLIYFPDFYLEELNTIIEIKSSYWYKIHEEKNIAKQKTCENLGYNYILIIDKNYIEFYKKIIKLF